MREKITNRRLARPSSSNVNPQNNISQPEPKRGEAATKSLVIRRFEPIVLFRKKFDTERVASGSEQRGTDLEEDMDTEMPTPTDTVMARIESDFDEHRDYLDSLLSFPGSPRLPDESDVVMAEIEADFDGHLDYLDSLVSFAESPRTPASPDATQDHAAIQELDVGDSHGSIDGASSRASEYLDVVESDADFDGNNEHNHAAEQDGEMVDFTPDQNESAADTVAENRSTPVVHYQTHVPFGPRDINHMDMTAHPYNHPIRDEQAMANALRSGTGRSGPSTGNSVQSPGGVRGIFILVNDALLSERKIALIAAYSNLRAAEADMREIEGKERMCTLRAITARSQPKLAGKVEDLQAIAEQAADKLKWRKIDADNARHKFEEMKETFRALGGELDDSDNDDTNDVVARHAALIADINAKIEEVEKADEGKKRKG